MNLFYPQVCGVCGKLEPEALCRKCEIRLQKIAQCEVNDFSKKLRYFNELFYIFQYEGEIRNILIKYKFNDKPYIYKTFAYFLKNYKKICVQIKKYDIIVPVPISKKRFNERGYNQSAIFAREIAKNLNITYNEKILIKIKDNIAQSLLEGQDREQNVKNVYKVINSEKLKNKKVLLVDDIYTTGSTVNECSRVLLLNGAQNIGIFTIAKD